VIDALSHSRFWASTVVFVLEDDSQDGPDHVDSHRSLLLMISAWNRAGVMHQFANTTDVLATIGRILHLDPMSQFDYYGRPIAGMFATAPDSRPYVALHPDVSLDERNPADRAAAHAAMNRLDLRREDPDDQDLFNRILWAMIKKARSDRIRGRTGSRCEDQRGYWASGRLKRWAAAGCSAAATAARCAGAVE
jgi:hypothetical protein